MKNIPLIPRLLFFGGCLSLAASIYIEHPYLSRIGLVLFIAAILINFFYFLIKKARIKNKAKERSNRIEQFKQKAQKERVDLTAVELTVVEWDNETVIDGKTYHLFNDGTRFLSLPFNAIDPTLNTVKLELHIDNRTIAYVINYVEEQTNLNLLLASQERSFLYVYGEEMYLDLEFLENEN